MKILFTFLVGLWLGIGSSACMAQEISKYANSFEIYILPEKQMSGNPAMFLGTKPEKNFTMSLNAYLLVNKQNTILIDAGFGNRLFTHLKKLNFQPEAIDTILLTHMHPDHIGGLLKDNNRAFPKATLWLAKQEYDYWTNKDIQKALPQNKQQAFILAQKVLAAYGDKVRTFSPQDIAKQEDSLFENVKAIAAFGHTPGHTAFLVGEGKDALLIWGDIVHAENIQLAQPEVGVIYDVDPKQAIETRKYLFDYIEKNNIKVTGMHIGRQGASVLKKKDSGYELITAP